MSNKETLENHNSKISENNEDLTVILNAINNLGPSSGNGDMLKSNYDTNNDGIVDNAEKVNGHTVDSDVPANAKFTDTVYDDTEVKTNITNLQNNKANKTDIPTVPTKTSDLINDSGFTPKSYVDNAVANAGGEISNAVGTLIRINKIDVKTQQAYENMELVEGTAYFIIQDEE